jgi:hypothetical protein
MALSTAQQDQIENATAEFQNGMLEDFLFSSKEEFEEIRLAMIESITSKLHCELYKAHFDEDDDNWCGQSVELDIDPINL